MTTKPPFPLFPKLFAVSAVVMLSFGCAKEVEPFQGDEGLPVRGFAMPAHEKGDFSSGDFASSCEIVRDMGSNYVGIHSTFLQDTARGTEIFDSFPERGYEVPGVEEQREAVRTAHRMGLAVLLKPHVNLRSGEGWRGDITLGMSEEELDAWFVSYGELILEHARMAEEEAVEMFAVGTELVEAQKHEARWRELVARVREVYKGPIIYCANHGTEAEVAWWDAVDYIGIDAYYPLCDSEEPTAAELDAAWAPILGRIAAISERTGRQVIFSEIGYTSVRGTAAIPFSWELTGPTDNKAQADCYEALFRNVCPQPWFDGLILWSWQIGRGDNPYRARDFTPEGKPAEDIVRIWFARSVSSFRK